MNEPERIEITDANVREKLVRIGAESLSDAELLSIIIRDGQAGSTALELSEELLQEFNGSLSRLSRCHVTTLRNKKQIGVRRAAVILAALELANRYKLDDSFMNATILSDKDVVAIFRPLIAHLPHEEFWVLYLTSANRVLDRICISKGGVTGTVADHKLIVKRAVEKLCTRIILVHNHPSGNSFPSELDKATTEQITRSASLFDIDIADHIIITADQSYSFRQHGFFDRP